MSNGSLREKMRLKMHSIASLEAAVQGWPLKSRRAIDQLVKAYGLPHEATPHMVVWYYNSPWKSTLVYRDGVAHAFPHSHRDVLKQTIDYQVPVDKMNDLIAFNGSLIIDRTAGEVAVCCESEEMNMLILNLAHDIVMGHRTVEEARRRVLFSQRMRTMNWPDPYRESLGFYHEGWWLRQPVQESRPLWRRALLGIQGGNR